MRIALFGGSFDPPHSGHLGIAMAAVERLHLDRVLMAPVGRQPLKRDQAQSPYEDRMAMVQLACAGHPPVAASAIDAPRVDGRYNYTCDTLQHLRETLPAGDELFCLVGADSLQTLRHWHRAAEALMLAEWIVAARPGFTQSVLSPCGKIFASGGGQRFGRISQFTSVLRFVPIITTRHGVVIVPEITAACDSRSTSFVL